MDNSYFNDDDNIDEIYSDEEPEEEEEEEEYATIIGGGNSKKKTKQIDDDEMNVILDEEEDELDEDEEDQEEDLEEEDEEDLDSQESDDEAEYEENEGEDDSIKQEKPKKIKQLPENIVYNNDDNDLENDDDGELYLKKFDKDIQKNYIMNFHPECVSHNYDEIEALSKVVRNQNGMVVDDLHKTLPYLTKYERTRILGQRAKQINSGATPFVKVPENVIDGYLVAELELKQKRIPFILRRPLPNGGSEYWNVKDLENISF
jgi:DNA-directed RNA polymerase subunit K/omega